MRAALLAGLAVGLAALVGPAAAQVGPGRVMSLDSCADQYVLALAPRQAIVGVSPRADAPDSFLRAKAAGLPKRRTTLEAVLGAAAKATATTPWVSAGNSWSLLLRPLLPDETGCADLQAAR